MTCPTSGVSRIDCDSGLIPAFDVTVTEVALADEGILTSLGVVTTSTSLTLPVDISYEDYEQIGAWIGYVHDATNWWLGAWLNQGEILFGDKIFQAALLTNRSPQTLRNVASIEHRVPSGRRNDKLSFTIHAEVAALEPEDQIRWLHTAEDEQLATHELRERIRAERAGTPDIITPEVCKCCGQKLPGAG